MVGFTLMKVSLCSHSVSPPKPSTITPDSHSIGETLPIFIFDTSMATAVAAMKAAVAVNTPRSEEHTSELQSLMRISYAVFCFKKKKKRVLKHSRISHTNTTHDLTRIRLKEH